ncbi:MAG: chromosomal replication initiator protein DnaA [Actinomyces urogenitalis]|nr:chromosomal replication initiator protein DnaA [Actinomyces urogenitalis]MDU6152621.1 chromosomal replication initiator protein DnaA [Actinomyces urogenitalis]
MTDVATTRWESALNLLATRQELGRGQIALLRMTRVIDVDDVLVLVVGFALPRDIIDKNHAVIARALAEVWGRAVTFEVTIDPAQESSSHSSDRWPDSTEAAAEPAQAPTSGTQPTDDAPASQDPVSLADAAPAVEAPSALSPDGPGEDHPAPATPSSSTGYVPPLHPTATLPAAEVVDDSRLNPRYTFATYVQGKSNRLARTAAAAVAEAPSRAYNPLFIYGGSGLGKTHLLHAIGHYARKLYPGITVKYVNSEEFVSDFIASVADGQMRNFKDRYRNVDILLVDDVQFFEGKEQTLEEFFHTFNALRIAEKQIVLTSDQPALELKGFNNRLISRFQEGLVADVQPPDLETRQAILTLKARADGISVTEDVLEYIASRVTTNIRELEGALVRVTAFASLNKQPIDRTLAEVALKDVITDPTGEEITSGLIMGQVADYFDMTIDDLCGESRRKNFVHPRHIAMYLCRELTELSLPNIGREFGGRDHTTVMSAHRKITTQMGERRETFNEVNELTSRIKQAALAPRR